MSTEVSIRARDVTTGHMVVVGKKKHKVCEVYKNPKVVKITYRQEPDERGRRFQVIEAKPMHRLNVIAAGSGSELIKVENGLYTTVDGLIEVGRDEGYWYVWDTQKDDYAFGEEVEFDTLAEARNYLKKKRR